MQRETKIRWTEYFTDMLKTITGGNEDKGIKTVRPPILTVQQTRYIKQKISGLLSPNNDFKCQIYKKLKIPHTNGEVGLICPIYNTKD